MFWFHCPQKVHHIIAIIIIDREGKKDALLMISLGQ